MKKILANILLVHGVGYCESTECKVDGRLKHPLDCHFTSWKREIQRGLKPAYAIESNALDRKEELEIYFHYFEYDDLFKDEDKEPSVAVLLTLYEVAKNSPYLLGKSPLLFWPWLRLSDLPDVPVINLPDSILISKLRSLNIKTPIGNLASEFEPIKKWYDSFRSSLGMTALFLNDDNLRRKLRNKLSKTIKDKKINLIVSHSLGGMICYDHLISENDSSSMALITMGTQIANPVIMERIYPTIRLPNIRIWYNLYNPQDPTGTNSIKSKAQHVGDHFIEITEDSPAGHDVAFGGAKPLKSTDKDWKGPGYLEGSAIWSAWHGISKILLADNKPA